MKPSNDREAITLVLTGISEKGWNVNEVDPGWGEDPIAVINVDDAITNVNYYDEATVYVEKNGTKSFIFFVLGNDPEEVVCDHGVNLSDDLDPIVSPWWE